MGRSEFSDRELDIMSALWEAGSGTVAEVRDRLDPNIGYTTVLKFLQILEEKGAVRHESEGRAYRYFPLVQPEDAGGKALDRILDKIFLGSADLLVARLVSDRKLSPEQLRKIRSILDDAEDEDAKEEDGEDAS